MGCHYFVPIVLLAQAVTASYVLGDASVPERAVVTTAIRRALPLLERGSAGSARERQCFTCHNQALPVLAIAEARKRGFKIDENNLERQLRHTEAHLKRGQKEYLEGRGQGGKVITAGYALWTLEAGGRESDDVTSSVTAFLLEYQNQEDHWSHPGRRPPSSGSDFASTYVALRGLAEFGSDEQAAAIQGRTEKIHRWLLGQQPRDTEDRVFRLRSLTSVGADDDVIRKAVAELEELQRDDGGWAQTPEMESDAYATATVLVALQRAAGRKRHHPAVRRGVQYLLDDQQQDGSWHVVTRATPFQTYFESGFPHGEDQFISIAASSWATIALLLELPESVAPDQRELPAADQKDATTAKATIH